MIVDEHIFGRLEGPYSRIGLSEYQPISQTNGISPAEAQELAIMAARFPNRGSPENRLQFFQLQSGRFCFAKCSPITSDGTDEYAQKIDSHHRDGFTWRAVVVSATDFAACGNNPFAILDAITPVNNTKALVQHAVSQPGDKQPENRDPINFSATSPAAPSSNFPAAYLPALTGLINETATSSAPVVQMNGSHESIHSSLRALINSLSPAARLKCTFDTYAQGCGEGAGKFWATGGSFTPTGQRQKAIASTDNGSVFVPEDPAPAPQQSQTPPPVTRSFFDRLLGR